MASFLMRRLVQVPFVLLGVSVLVFFGLRLGPFDPTVVAAESSGDPEVVERLYHEYGLDRPLLEQYASYLSSAIRGDLGRSFIGNRPVVDSIVERIPATLELALGAMFIGTVLGVGLGVLAAMFHDRAPDSLSRVVTLVGVSIPTFWLGIVAIALFAVILGWLPAGGRFPAREVYEPITGFILVDAALRADGAAFVTALKHLIMPATILGLFIASFIGRVTRASVLEQLDAPYVKTIRAKGVSRTSTVFRHSLRNALIPIVTIMGIQFGIVLGGAVVTETVFGWPGLGKLLVDAINVRDFPQIQAGILVIATIYVVVNLTVDVTYGLLDPRVRT